MKVLVADGARTASLFTHATRVGTLAEARAALANDVFGLLVVGARFDDSRMFDLIREVRADARYASLRIVCVIPTPALAPACEALGAVAVLESAISAVTLTSGGRP